MNTLVSVKVRNGEIDKALRIFKKRVFDSGHLLELKNRTEFEKPSVTKRKEKKLAIYRQKLSNMLGD
jgi:small subunit ribosomal protein S21